MTTINVAGIEELRQKLKDMAPLPSATSTEIAEVLRLAGGFMSCDATKAGALGVAWEHLRLEHERRMSEYNQRIVTTEADLAALGVKRLGG